MQILFQQMFNMKDTLQVHRPSYSVSFYLALIYYMSIFHLKEKFLQNVKL